MVWAYLPWLVALLIGMGSIPFARRMSCYDPHHVVVLILIVFVFPWSLAVVLTVYGRYDPKELGMLRELTLPAISFVGLLIVALFPGLRRFISRKRKERVHEYRAERWFS